jgi:fumarate hydratase class II
MANGDFRTERDSMGEMQVPVAAYYGASTMRAVLNFPISDLRMPPPFLRALGLIKQASARANGSLTLLSETQSGAIAGAAGEVAEGRWDGHFVVDVFESGSGTSHNMNANEIIARRASETAGQHIHANDHVNLGQSSNDVVPSAIRLAALELIRDRLRPALQGLQEGLAARSRDFWDVIKTGRTHLQDATPIRLGQEFLGYAGQVQSDLARLDAACADLAELPLGGTAVGTGIGAAPEFAGRAIEELKRLTGLPLRETDNHFQAQSSLDSLLAASSVLRTTAVTLIKVANDVRWLGSGPRAGLGELELPAVQPGSSIMPGKVNPVIAESLLQSCAQVIGNDAVIALAAQGSHFELNMMMPVAGYNLLQAISLLAAAAANFDQQCLRGLKATSRGPDLVANGLGIATALAPRLGYDGAARVAYEAVSKGESVRAAAQRLTDLSDAELDRLLDPSRLVQGGRG